jgi:hypothetical protein
VSAQEQAVEQSRLPLRGERIELFPKSGRDRHQKQQYKLENRNTQ